MSTFIIEIWNNDFSTRKGTVELAIDVGFRYTDKLNEINECEFKFSGTGTEKRSLLSIGSGIIIKKNGVNDFKGYVMRRQNMDGGGIIVHGVGSEIKTTHEKGTYSNSPWLNTASATIFSDIIGESSFFTAGTINTGSDIDFRLSTSQSIWNGLGNLTKKTSQDIQIDYLNDEIDILDNRGSSTSVLTLNDKINCDNIVVDEAFPIGNDVRVFGKGDGEDQIKSNPATAGQDATSKSTYGTIRHDIIDRSIITQDEADKLADSEVARLKDAVKIYDIQLLNPNETITTGDIITLYSLDKDVNGEELRIVGIERGIKGGKEILQIQVTNPEFKQLAKQTSDLLNSFRKDQIDADTYMQGSGNTLTWGSGINAKTNYPLQVRFQVPATFIEDEAGNIRVDSMTVDYDVDPFKSQYGSATFSGSDPQVQNSSANTQPDVENSSGSTGPSVTGTSASSGESSWTSTNSGNSSSLQSGTLTDSSWTTIINTSNLSIHSDLVFVYVTFKNDNLSNNRTIRVRATIDGKYFPNSAGTWTNVDAGDYVTIPIMCPVDIYGDDVYVEAQTESGDMDYEATWNYQILSKHTHADGSYAAASHSHDDGSYSAANHLHADGSYDINAADLNNISIGDDVDEAGSVNASSINIYLDYWNGSSWVNKHSILGTGATLENDVDITNSGTYPDAVGLWRVRFEPITGSADFMQGIVKIKHALDN